MYEMSLNSFTKDPKKDTDDNVIELKRNVRLVDAVFMIIGNVIGTGIFITPVGVFKDAGSIGMALLVWIFSGVYCLIGGLVYAELGTLIPRSGSSYTYIKEILGRPPAFIYVWSMILAPQASNAATALSFAIYITKPLFLSCDPPTLLVSILALVMFLGISYINGRSVPLTLRIINSLTFIKLIPLAAIIIVGLYYLFTGTISRFQNPFDDTKSIGSISHSIYSALFTYSGFNSVCYITSELHNPKKDLRRSVCIALPVIILVFTFANVGYFAVLSDTEILSSPAIVVTFAEKTLGPFKYFIHVFIALSIAGALLGGIYVGSRTYFVGAQDGCLPAFISYVHYRYFTPVPCVIMMTVIVCSFIVISGNIFDLLKFNTINDTVVNIVTVISLLWVRYKGKDDELKDKLPAFLPVIYVIISSSILIFSLTYDPINNGIGLVILFMYVPIYFVLVKAESLEESHFLRKTMNNVNRQVSKITSSSMSVTSSIFTETK